MHHGCRGSTSGSLVQLDADVARGGEGAQDERDGCDLGMFPAGNSFCHPYSPITLDRQSYSTFRLPRYPTLTPQVIHFFQGTDSKTSIGPYWQQPGRLILEEHLVAVPDPGTVIPGAFKDFMRCYFTGVYLLVSKTSHTHLLFLSRHVPSRLALPGAHPHAQTHDVA